MASRRQWIACAALAAATFAGNWRDISEDWLASRRMRAAWEGRPYRANGPHVDTRRGLIERHMPADARLFLLTNDGRRLSPMARIIHHGVSWATSPTPVAFGPGDAYGGEDFVATAPFDAPPAIRDDPRHPVAFEELRDGHVALWARKDRAPSTSAGEPSASRVPSTAEALGLLAPALAFGLAWRRGRFAGGCAGLVLLTLAMAGCTLAGCRPSRWFAAAAAVAAGLAGGAVAARDVGSHASRTAWPGRIATTTILAVFVLVAGTLALSHTFLSPNGLGVYGGKAKLLFLAPGIPAGFFTDPARSTLQPAYPPGFTLLTLGCYGLAGGCGEYVTQLLPIALAGLVLYRMTNRNGVVAPCAVWILAAFLTRQPLRMVSQFYAEPMMALLVVVGWEGIRRSPGASLFPWLLVGSAGWVKNEGVLFLPALWIGLRATSGARAAPWRGLLAGLVLPVAWHVGCRVAGGTLYDFGPLWKPDWTQALAAARLTAAETLGSPWRTAFVFPATLAALALPAIRRHVGAPFRAAALANALLLTAFVGIFAISTSEDFAWHVASLRRILWTPALLLLRELAALGEAHPTHWPSPPPATSPSRIANRTPHGIGTLP